MLTKLWRLYTQRSAFARPPRTFTYGKVGKPPPLPFSEQLISNQKTLMHVIH